MISTPSKDFAGIIRRPSRVTAGLSSATPKAMGIEGPVISASRMAVWWPLRFMLTASMEVTRDLPTPPFPLTMPMTFFTLLSGANASKKLVLSVVRLSQFALQEPQS